MPEPAGLPLSELETGDRATVQSIDASDPELLRYLSSIGLTPLSEVTVLGVSPFDGNIRLQVDGQPEPVVLGSAVTSRIFVILRLTDRFSQPPHPAGSRNDRFRAQQSVNLNALDNSCQPTQNQFRKVWRTACDHPAVELAGDRTSKTRRSRVEKHAKSLMVQLSN